jgi:hypothetical protein
MEIINLANYVDDQINFFVEKFKSIGWKQEDLAYLFKRTPFLVNPEARNIDYQYGFGLVFYSQLLQYGYGKNEMLTPWVVGRVELESPTSEILKNVTDFIKEEVKNIGWKMFYDEDSFRNNFSKEERRDGYIRLKFYLNKYYSAGWWENHTL